MSPRRPERRAAPLPPLEPWPPIRCVYPEPELRSVPAWLRWHEDWSSEGRKA